MTTDAMSLPTLQPFFGGAFHATDGPTFETRDPARDTLIADVTGATAADVDAAVTAAWSAYRGAWGALSLADRSRLLSRVAELIDSRREQLAALEALDGGKPIRDCEQLIAGCAEEFEWFSDVAQKLPGAAYPVDHGVHSFSTVEAYGVVAGITPWNFPLTTAISKVAPALAMGNSFILKPAEQTPLTALALAEICAEAGLPDGAIAVLPGGPDTGAALAAHPGVPLVSFTGSTEVGRRIARGAADRIQRVILELGGKSPVLVFDDAPLDAMADATLSGFTYSTGQICVASTRLITQPNVHDELLARLLARARDLTLGDPLDPATEVGPLVSKEQLDRVSGYVDQGRRGARILTGGRRARLSGLEDGFFFAPTIIEGLDHDSPLVREEIFGPVLSVLPASSEEDAVRIANDTTYGLAAYLWTGDLSRAHRVARQLEAGSVSVNCFESASGYGAPFGGWKQSGVGVEGGLEGARAYSRSKVVTIALTRTRRS